MATKKSQVRTLMAPRGHLISDGKEAARDRLSGLDSDLIQCRMILRVNSMITEASRSAHSAGMPFWYMGCVDYRMKQRYHSWPGRCLEAGEGEGPIDGARDTWMAATATET